MTKQRKPLIPREPTALGKFASFRSSKRVRRVIPVTIRDNDGLEVELLSRDLSETGIFVLSSILFDVGQVHVLEFKVDDKKVVRVWARVVRIEGVRSHERRPVMVNSMRDAGMGYEFFNTDECTRREIRAFIRS